jgi:L-phenylalanine/L-methionine N-acetyltransferase
MTLSIRRVEPSDYEAMHKIFVGPRVVWGTLQLPHPSVDGWRRALAEPRDGSFGLVACIYEMARLREA